ncbi:MAG: peptidoglycan bridge formation glycyltransferase FemA/FemB family protein [Candidatus Saccharibacteria bacterium]
MSTFKQCQDKQEWDEFIMENGGHPLQLWGWGEVKSANGWKAYRLFLHDDDVIMGAVQLLVRKLPLPLRSLAYVPRGPVVDDGNREELLSSLADYVKKNHHSVVLTVEPDSIKYSVPKDWRKSKTRVLPARTIVLDLKKSDSELLSDMAKKTRQYIRKSASETMTIKMVRNKLELDKCLSLYHATAKRAKFDLHPDHYYYDIYSKLEDHSQIFAAYVDDQPVAFLWLAISADTAFELYGGVDDLGQQLRSNYALKWHAILKCKEWGLSRYDFGGLLEGGVSTFKKGWAVDETELAGTFDRPLSAAYSIWSKGLPMAKVVSRKTKKLFKR